MRLRRLSRTKDQASSSGERVLTVEESLQSIAVELHQGNKLFARFLAIAEENRVVVAAGSPDTHLLEKLIEPVTAMLTRSLARPARIASTPTTPATVTKEGNGTRVEQRPEV